MKSLKRKLRRRASVILKSITPDPGPTRTGWPPLSETPLLRQRRTDALPWHPGHPPDEWKR